MTRTRTVEKSGKQSSNDPFEFVLSSDSVDRMGDTIQQNGWQLKQFLENPVALAFHDHSAPIGRWENVRVVGKQLRGKLVLAKEGTSDRIDEIRKLIEQKILKAVSVGFRVEEYNPIDKGDPWGPWNITKATLLEVSAVTVPANPDAISLAKSLGVSDDTLGLIFEPTSKGVLAPSRRNKPALGVTAATTRKSETTKGKVKPMKIGERIVVAEDELNSARDEISALVKGAEDDARDLTDEESDQIEALSGNIEAQEKSLSALRKAEAALARRDVAKSTAKAGYIPAKAAPNEKASDMMFKRAAVEVIAHLTNKDVQVVAEERYGHDPRVLDVVKAATTGATTTDAGWAAELTQTANVGFLEDLGAVSIYGALAAAGTAIPFGDNASISVPARSGNGDVSGSFVGEGNSIPVKADSYNAQMLYRYKAAVITVVSKELQRVSNPQVEALLRSAITSDTGDMLDSVLMDPANNVIANIRPASPWFGNTPITGAANGDLAAVIADLKALINALSAQNAGRNPRLVMNPVQLTGLSMMVNATGSFVWRDEIAQGRVMGIPVISSTNCPAGVVYIIDAADFATAFGNSEFDISEQATLAFANDTGAAPLMTDENAISGAGSIHISDAAGTTPPTGVQSLFQTWQLGIRMVMPITWKQMRPTTAHVTGVTW